MSQFVKNVRVDRRALINAIIFAYRGNEETICRCLVEAEILPDLICSLFSTIESFPSNHQSIQAPSSIPLSPLSIRNISIYTTPPRAPLLAPTL